jgi:hypothetical protein
MVSHEERWADNTTQMRYDLLAAVAKPRGFARGAGPNRTHRDDPAPGPTSRACAVRLGAAIQRLDTVQKAR